MLTRIESIKVIKIWCKFSDLNQAINEVINDRFIRLISSSIVNLHKILAILRNFNLNRNLFLLLVESTWLRVDHGVSLDPPLKIFYEAPCAQKSVVAYRPLFIRTWFGAEWEAISTNGYTIRVISWKQYFNDGSDLCLRSEFNRQIDWVFWYSVIEIELQSKWMH